MEKELIFSEEERLSLYNTVLDYMESELKAGAVNDWELPPIGETDKLGGSLVITGLCSMLRAAIRYTPGINPSTYVDFGKIPAEFPELLRRKPEGASLRDFWYNTREERLEVIKGCINDLSPIKS